MIGIIGSGNVGANTAFFLAEQHFGPIVMHDIQEGLSVGKSLDLMEAAPIRKYRSWIRGTDSPEEIFECDVIILTAGGVRKPGMKREELYEENKELIIDYAKRIKNPAAKVIIVTEPVDMLTTLFAHHSPLPKKQIIGLGSVLDAARLRFLIAKKLQVSIENVTAQVFGRHSDEMIILADYCSVSGICVNEFLSAEEFDEIVEETKSAGSLIVDMAQRASAYYGPSSVAAELGGAIEQDRHSIYSVSQILEGQYGIEGVALSLPAVICSGGISVSISPSFNQEQIDILTKGAEFMKRVIGLGGAA